MIGNSTMRPGADTTTGLIDTREVDALTGIFAAWPINAWSVPRTAFVAPVVGAMDSFGMKSTQVYGLRVL
jgi:hypothetical protein